jgi:hypothetical protein
VTASSATGCNVSLRGIALLLPDSYGLYHLGVYALRRRETAALYFGVFCLAVAARTIAQGDKTALSQYLSWELSYKAAYLTIFVAAACMVMFFRSIYPQEVPKAFARVSQAMWGLLALLVLALSATVVNDMLNQSRIITSGYWSSAGFLLLIFTQAYVLSARFARALDLSEELSENLEKKVHERTSELSRAKEQLQQGNDLIRRYVPPHLAEAKKWFEEGIQTPFRIRIGINTGTASVGNYGSAGRMTFSAIGNQTNLAGRIQSECEPGKVLIGHSTWALVKDEITCVDKGEIDVKGLHYPIRAYEVSGKSPGD